MLRLHLLLGLLLLLGGQLTFSQTLTTNSSGEQIIVYPDGSWRYFVARDSVPADAVPEASDSETRPTTVEIQTAPSSDRSRKKRARREAKQARESRETSTEESTRANAESTTTRSGSDDSFTPKAELLDDITVQSGEIDAEEEARARSIVRKQLKRQNKAIGKQQEEIAKARRHLEKEQLSLLNLRKSDKAKDQAKVDVANRTVQERRRSIENMEAELEENLATADIFRRAIPMTRARRTEYFFEAGLLERNADQSQPEVAATLLADPQLQTEDRPRKRDKDADASSLASYSPQQDPRLNPPKPTCNLAVDRVDDFTRKRRRELEKEIFFTHTTDELKPYLGSEDLITADGQLTANGSAIVFEVDYIIRSQYANREFGTLPRGSALTVRLIGGGIVTLKNLQLSQGEYDPVDKVYHYTARYPITKGQVKSLSKSLVDQVRVMWGTGFEDYPVYDISYFSRQLSCL